MGEGFDATEEKTVECTYCSWLGFTWFVERTHLIPRCGCHPCHSPSRVKPPLLFITAEP
ncbi:hypothetical protein Hanom_Chr14g01269591 [Helianthus anomalus]